MHKLSKLCRQRSSLMLLSCFLLSWLSLKTLHDITSCIPVVTPKVYSDSTQADPTPVSRKSLSPKNSSTFIIWLASERLFVFPNILSTLLREQFIHQVLILGSPSILAQVNHHLQRSVNLLPAQSYVYIQAWTPDLQEVQNWKHTVQQLSSNGTHQVSLDQVTLPGSMLFGTSPWLNRVEIWDDNSACVAPLDQFRDGAVVSLPFAFSPSALRGGHFPGGVLSGIFQRLDEESRLMELRTGQDGCREVRNISAAWHLPLLETSEAIHHTPPLGTFVVLLATAFDVQALCPVLFMLKKSGHNIQVFITEHWSPQDFQDVDCGLDNFRNIFWELGLSMAWANTVLNGADIVITTPDMGDVLPLAGMVSTSTIVVEIPRADLRYSTWLNALTLNEWKNWKTPRIEISVITNNRPDSLQRLLHSLQLARFYGDEVNIRFNTERNSDATTMQVIDRFNWDHGTVSVHHRVIQGGLIAAVVESWYPHGNDTYGILLEDDIEVSPLFYAWSKMALLRYRYGEAFERSNRLFGISLYQQKVLELPPSGRKLFNARDLFYASGLPYPTTPYLSSIPCSWGGLYFPEHWREFHSFLQMRLETPTINQVRHIVPGVRSNHWRSSWKKFFIELVYLRGYVMLYPNYDDYLSFSTNHLEPGSHVKVVSPGKRDMFKVPLMGLSDHQKVLDFPHGQLPRWKALPVLNLNGSLSSLVGLDIDGRSRRIELTGCSESMRPFHAVDLFC
ncbi:hypothetical protein BDN72DRAFT_424768 [Pluteus cervinus]|uniref:Uncharacterized protein n=1 Tax=Pluteus cervinus TaxID=181527 RepID=A0ACD3B1Y6_9AGAR|nr:hypothetical protein BDN72DRAFT_424768 [Pluteus cervinus]